MKYWKKEGDSLYLKPRKEPKGHFFPEDSRVINLQATTDGEIVFTEGCDNYFEEIMTGQEAIDCLQEAIDWIKEHS